MKQILNFQAKITEENGRKKLIFSSPQYYKFMIQRFKVGEDITVSLENKKSQRSLRQNAYWWGVCYPVIAETTGHTVEEIHEIMKQMFLPKKFLAIKGIEFEIPKSSKKLTISEGVEYTDKIRNFSAQELEAPIPTPCEAGYFCGRQDCPICNKQ